MMPPIATRCWWAVHSMKTMCVLVSLPNSGKTTLALRRQLAVKALKETAAYDEIISATLEKNLEIENNLLNKMGPIRAENVKSIDQFPEHVSISLVKQQSLRYGENPHQQAAIYRGGPPGIVNAVQSHGKEMSFNNYTDADAALRAAYDHSEPCVAIIKHANPCGIATANDVATAHKLAHECDPIPSSR